MEAAGWARGEGQQRSRDITGVEGAGWAVQVSWCEGVVVSWCLVRGGEAARAISGRQRKNALYPSQGSFRLAG